MKLKIRSSARFLASVFAGIGTSVRKDGLATYVDLNYSLLQPLTSFDPSTKQIAINDSITGLWNQTTLSNLLALSGYVATSVTPLTIGLGTVSFTTQAGLAYRAGARVRASHAADTSKYMEGLVTSYSGTTLTVSISKVSGAGTFSDWNLSLAGDPGTGDMLSVNNGLDFANLPTTLNNLSGVSFANAQTLTGAQQLQARKNIGVVSGRGEINILDFGGVGDGATDNTAAFNAAWAALGTYGGCIYFPAGKYVFNSAIAKTLPASQFSIAIRGDGSNASILFWPNAAGGISLTASNTKNTFMLFGLALFTGQANGGTAFRVAGNGAVYPPTSYIYDVTIQGDDFVVQGTGTHYWALALDLFNWSNISVYHTNTFGLYGAPGSAGGGVGLRYQGNATTTTYATILNVYDSSFNYHAGYVSLGSYWQGITLINVNLNGVTGTQGLQQSGGATGVLVGLWIIGSQFNTAGVQIDLQTAIGNVQITSNQIGIQTNNGVGINSGSSYGVVLGHNIISGVGAGLTGTYAVTANGARGNAVGNYLSNLANGFILNTSSSNWVVGLNTYDTVTSKVINNGTGNSVGTAAAGNMTGVVP